MIIYVLLVAHFVGDFLCQSDWMAVNKSQRWDALALHVLAYSAVLAVAVIVGHGDTPQALWFLSTNVAAHFIQDAITSRINARLWFLDTTTGARDRYLHDGEFIGRFNDKRHWFFVGIGFDQLLHYVTLFVTAGWWLR